MPKFNDSIARIGAINLERSRRWHGGGLDGWSLSDWFTALAGEMGEAGNVIKKLNRLRDALPGNKNDLDENNLTRMLGEELADVYLYLDLLAQRAGLDLGAEVRAKFNRKSAELQFPERL